MEVMSSPRVQSARHSAREKSASADLDYRRPGLVMKRIKKKGFRTCSSVPEVRAQNHQAPATQQSAKDFRG